MSSTERWSWRKFLSGPIIGKNYAKALVMLICMSVILFIFYSVFLTVQRFLRPKEVPTQAIGTNSGTIVTNNEDKRGNSYSLLNLFNWK